MSTAAPWRSPLTLPLALSALLLMPPAADAQFRAPGDDCSQPITLTLPADMPFHDIGQTTCGRGNDFAGTALCGGATYGGGEEIVYRLVVTEQVYADILVEPRGTPGVLLLVAYNCWPTVGCNFHIANESAEPRLLRGMRLTPGTYHVVIDVAPAYSGTTCIPAFDLSITGTEGACCVGDACVGNIAPDTCAALGGRWYSNDRCETLHCPELITPVPSTCGQAVDIGGPPRAVLFRTASNAPAPPAGSCNAAGLAVMQNSAWLRFTATADGPIDVTTRYDYNGLIAVYRGGCGALEEVVCANSGSQLTDGDQFTLEAVAGTTYWLQIGDYGVNPMGGWTHVFLSGASGPAVRRGDANCDGAVNFADIGPFIAALKNLGAWQAAYPGCPAGNPDANGDGAVNFGDISAFIAILKQGG